MLAKLGRREPCVSCGEPVFLAERLVVDTRLYHRTCFRCARCGAQLSLASCYQTETDGQYCCEICPDEESDSQDCDINSIETGYTSISKTEDHKSDSKDSGQNAYNRMLSDEEKVRNVQQFKDALDAENSAFNRSLRGSSIKSSSSSSKALSGFLSSQFDDEAPALPTSLPPVAPAESIFDSSLKVTQPPVSIDLDTSSPVKAPDRILESPSVQNKYSSFVSETCPSPSLHEATDNVKFKHLNSEKKSDVSVDKKVCEMSPSQNKLLNISGVISPDIKVLNNRVDHISNNVENDKKIHPNSTENELQSVNIDKVHVNQPTTASDIKENKSNLDNTRDYFYVKAEPNDVIAKENQRNVKSNTFDDKNNDDDEMSQGTSGPSLVRMRMKLFETVSPEKNRLSDITVSPIGSRKSIVDQEKLVLTTDKISVIDSVNTFSSNSINQGSTTVDVTTDNEDTAALNYTDFLPNINTEEESRKLGLEDISGTNVPCVDSFILNDSTITSDIDTNNSDSIENIDSGVVFSESNVETNESVSKEENIIVSIANEYIDSPNLPESATNINKEDVVSDMDNKEVITEENAFDVPSNSTEYHLDTNVKVNNDIHNEEKDVEDENEDKGKEIMNDKEDLDVEQKECTSLTDEKSTDDIKNTNSETVIIDILDSPKDITKMETSLPLEEPKKSNDDEYPEDLNPFGSDEDEVEQMPEVPKRKITPTNRHSLSGNIESTIEVIESPTERVSTNPFGSCSEDEDEPAKTNVPIKRTSGEKPPRPPPPAILLNANKQNLNQSHTKKLIPAINLNPFDSDDDEVSDDEKNLDTPVPKPRHRTSDCQDPQPVPRYSLGSGGPPSFHGSSSSLSSTVSRRKKAQAPKPPSNAVDTPIPAPRTTNKGDDLDTSFGSLLSSPNTSLLQTSPQLSPRSRKRRPAPAPPTASSTFLESPPTVLPTVVSDAAPHRLQTLQDELVACSPIVCRSEDTKSITSINSNSRRVISAVDFDEPDPEMTNWDRNKLDDDEKANDNKGYSLLENKSTSGVWKRRKGPAPAVPILTRRVAAAPMSSAALRRELALLEQQQRGLERQGVRLEGLIRARDQAPPGDAETDALLLQLFELVNEKNELFRRQAELMYIRRQQRLEEEHADLEHQLRSLMARPEANKTDADKAREEQLLQRLLHVVERRDAVVAALEADRLRERTEDEAVGERMAAHRAKLDENSSISSAELLNNSAKKEKKKEKKKWMKRDKQKKGEETNINEEDQNVFKKEKKAKKWF